VSEIDLIVTDGHDGLLAAVSALFPAPLRQRCLVHKQRNVMNAIPKREYQEVVTELTGNGRAGEARGCAPESGRFQSQISEALS
jgi:transposase-like protein